MNDAACFHCQQSVEKCLRAALTRRGVEFPLSHELGNLLDLLPPDISLGIDHASIEALTTFAVNSRSIDE